MANGNPGDHPLTDLLLYKRPTFSPEIDKLILEIAALGGEKQLEKTFNLFRPPPFDVFEAELAAIRDRLKREAKERGWEVS